MTLTLSEGAVDAVRDYLIANMAAKIVEINERSTDATVVIAPATYVIGEPELRAVKNWPVCYVLTTGFDVNQWQVVPGGGGLVDATHNMQVGVIVMDTEPERLQRRDFRTLTALFELIKASMADPDNLGQFQVVGHPRVAYSATFIAGKDYRLEGAVQFDVRRREIH